MRDASGSDVSEMRDNSGASAEGRLTRTQCLKGNSVKDKALSPSAPIGFYKISLGPRTVTIFRPLASFANDSFCMI